MVSVLSVSNIHRQRNLTANVLLTRKLYSNAHMKEAKMHAKPNAISYESKSL